MTYTKHCEHRLIFLGDRIGFQNSMYFYRFCIMFVVKSFNTYGSFFLTSFLTAPSSIKNWGLFWLQYVLSIMSFWDLKIYRKSLQQTEKITLWHQSLIPSKNIERNVFLLQLTQMYLKEMKFSISGSIKKRIATMDKLALCCCLPFSTHLSESAVVTVSLN